MRKFLSALMCVLFCVQAFALDIDFSYAPAGSTSYKIWGFGKRETYDVAIKIDDPTLVGTRVSEIAVPIPAQAEYLEELSAWISSELILEDKANKPDLESVEATLDGGVLSAKFKGDVTIPEGGLYVGYTFTVTRIVNDYTRYPIGVIEGTNKNGLYVHSSRSQLKWVNAVPELGAVSVMQVRLTGDFGDSDAAVMAPSALYTVPGEGASVTATVVNHGTAPISEIDYTYTIGDKSSASTLKLDTPVGTGNAMTSSVTFPVVVPEEYGAYSFSITLDKINGNVNGDPVRKAEAELNVVPVIPVSRPLVEEYTGLQCQYCPAGYVTMEEMSKELGDRFVGLVYHCNMYESNDKMVIMPTNQFPVYPSTGLPSGVVNRGDILHPLNFPQAWPEAAAEVPVAEVEAELKWTDGIGSKLEATGTATFIKNYENAGYKFSIAILADNLKSDDYVQTNAYAGQGDPDGSLWDLFTQGERSVKGLTFNDVVVYYKDVKGIAGSIPSNIEIGKPVSYTITVDPADIVNLAGGSLLLPGSKLKAVAIVLDADGKPINSNKSTLLEATGVQSVAAADAAVVETYYVTPQGVRVQGEPQKGLFIRVQRLDNGSIRTDKVVL